MPTNAPDDPAPGSSRVRLPITDEWKTKTRELLQQQLGYGYQTKAAEQINASVKTVQAILAIRPGGRMPVVNSGPVAEALGRLAGNPLPSLRDYADDEFSRLMDDIRAMGPAHQDAAKDMLRAYIRGHKNSPK